MAETELKNEEVFKHFNEMKRNQCKIADVKDLLEDNRVERIFAIKRFEGKGVILKPIGILDSAKITNEFRDELKRYREKAAQMKKIMLKKKEDWTEEEKDLIVSETNMGLMDYEIALITEIFKEPKLTREETRAFLNNLTEDEYTEFMTIASGFFNVSEEDLDKIKNLWNPKQDTR